MPAINVHRQITIEASVNQIKEVLLDFKQWPVWSPWLIQEPECRVTYAEDGSSYQWEGKRVGQGAMKKRSNEKQSLTYELTFLKPWKSTASVRFDLIQLGAGNTRVVWLMESQLPWALFWMKKMMEAFVGMDYARGLKMLKSYIEKGYVASQLEFIGETTFEGFRYIGLNNTATIADLGGTMGKDCQRLEKTVFENNIQTEGKMFSLYREFSPQKNIVRYVVGVPISEDPENLEQGMFVDTLPKSKVYKLGHVGSYEYLSNAWATLEGMQRAKEFKGKKNPYPFEVYCNNPCEVKETELRTEIYFPIK